MLDEHDLPPRVRAAKYMDTIMFHLGALTATVPRGPLRDKVDDEVEHMAALWEDLGNWDGT